MTSVAGNTTVNAGATLRYDVDGRINNLRGAGTVRASGNLTVGAGNFSGVITGAGHLIKSNTGGLILSGDNTYTGGTAVTAGVLQVGNGGASGSLGSGAISVTGTGVLDFSRAGTLIVADAISGNGTLRHNGTGTTVITDAGTFSGTTNVNRGILAVNGALGGATNVNSGGTLGGNGTLGNVNVMSGGVLAPGNSIGTLTVNGNLTFSAGSIYRVETDAAGNADRINVNGNLSINGGTVDVRAGSGNYARNTRYTILTNTGAQSGTFAGVSSNLAFLTPTLFYDANNVYLNLLSANAPSYTSVAQTPNQRSVANYLNSFANNPGNAQAEALIRQIDNLSADQARNAFDALSGSQHASASQVALAGTRGFHEVLGRRLVSMDTGGFGGAAALRNQAFGLQSPATPWNSADAPVQLAGLFGGAPAAGATSTLNGAVMGMRGGGAGPGTARGSTDHGGAGHGDAGRDTGMAASGDGDAGTPGSGNNTNGLWGQALGAGGRIASDGNGAGSAYRAGGFMAGYERALSEAWTAGAAAGYVRSSWEASTSGIAPASGKVATPQAALYARHARGAWRLSVTGSYAEHRFDTSRTVTVGTASSSATSSHRGREWGFSTQAEVALDAGAWQLRPLAGLRHTQLREDAFSESGNAGTALAVDRRVTRSTTFSAGARLLRPFGGKDSGNAQGGWELRAVYAHLFGDNDAPLSARLAGQAASFTVNGTPLRRDALQLGAGVSAQIGRGLAAFADLSYEARGSGQDAYAIGAGLRYLW
jgi:outer membrane autotransporter protein